jgi:hypothetical protein
MNYNNRQLDEINSLKIINTELKELHEIIDIKHIDNEKNILFFNNLLNDSILNYKIILENLQNPTL